MQISRSEIDKFIHKNAKTEDEIRREHPEESAAAIAHARAWFENTFKGGHTTSEEEAKETKRLAEEWRKKWDEQGVAHK